MKRLDLQFPTAQTWRQRALKAERLASAVTVASDQKALLELARELREMADALEVSVRTRRAPSELD